MMMRSKARHLSQKVIRHLPLDRLLLVKEGLERSKHLNRQLAWSLAFVAGAVNAGGFLAVKVYTSHVTGTVSKIADEWVLGHFSVVWAALAAVGAFFGGAFFAGLLVNLGRRRRFRGYYAFSLSAEALLLLAFGVLGSRFKAQEGASFPAMILLLSWIMGMHNAVVTKISNASVRTTHLTGVVTDLGIEISRYFYLNRTPRRKVAPVMANRDQIKLHGLILASFFAGAVLGAIGFKTIGYVSTVPLACVLWGLSFRPLYHDVRLRGRMLKNMARGRRSGSGSRD